jgi:hypothetical protein
LRPIKRKFRDEKGNEWVAEWYGTATSVGSRGPEGPLPNNYKAHISFKCLWKIVTDPTPGREENCNTFISLEKAKSLKVINERELQGFLSKAKRQTSK